jgi:hypothetical protein
MGAGNGVGQRPFVIARHIDQGQVWRVKTGNFLQMLGDELRLGSRDGEVGRGIGRCAR